MRVLLPEPLLKERRPGFRDIPAAILDKISALCGAPVSDGAIVHGGFSAAANFMLTLANGRKVFAKGNHPGDESHGAQNLRQELAVYENAPVLREISPRPVGVVGDGDEDGWMLGLWEWIDHGPLPDLAATLETLEKWQRADIPALNECREQSYISGFFSPERKWRRLGDEMKVRESFLSLFADRGMAEAWLGRHLPVLLALQDAVADLRAPEGPLHGDLRADNIFPGQDGRVYIVDWPNACRGPLAFDLVMLGASLEMQGRHFVENMLHGQPRDACLIMAAVLSGYFAESAGRAVPEKLPRLRWMQKSMLTSLLSYLSRENICESLPEMQGQFLPRNASPN
jgi:aminoglycoside phosphotransferase (APT) family kinase protein